MDVSEIGEKVGNNTYKVDLIGNETNTSISTAGTGQIIDPNNNTKILENVTINTTKTVDLVIVVRDVLTPEWLGMLTSSGSELQKALLYQKNVSKYDVTNESQYEKALRNDTLVYQSIAEKLSLNQSGNPIVHARVSLEGKAKDGNDFGVAKGEGLQFTKYTDSNGIVIFKNVTQGFYWLDVDALGYRPYNLLFPVAEETTKKPFVVLLVPDYYKVKVTWSIAVNRDMNNYILWSDYNESLSSSETYVALYEGTPISDADIIKTGFQIQKDLWYDNLHRIQSMYGWLGVDNPDLPLYGLSEQMLYAQNMIYTQSMYANPMNPQSIYTHQKHLLGVILGIVAIVVMTTALLQEAMQKAYYVKIERVQIDINAVADTTVQAREGYNPELVLMTQSGVAPTTHRLSDTSGAYSYVPAYAENELKPYQAHTGTLTFWIDIPDYPTTIGSPNSDYYLYYTGTYMKGSFTIVVWGKDMPSDSVIVLHSLMKVHYTLYEKSGVYYHRIGEEKHEVYSDGLEDELRIHVLTNAWGE